MENTQLEDDEENGQPLKKDRSLIYMGVVLGLIIMAMGYLTLYVDDPFKVFRAEESPKPVVEDSRLLLETSSMSDGEVRQSLVRFIEAFYSDQRRGYFDPPSYFAPITETFYIYHNLTYRRLKDIYWKQMADMENMHRTWYVSTLDFERRDTGIVATYWAKESYFKPSLRIQQSQNVKYEMIINESGKIVSLKDIEYKNFESAPLTLDSTAVVTDPAAANSEVVVTGNLKVYDASTVDTQPEFPGGQKEWAKYLATMRYPPAAKEKNVQGKVYVAFTVDKDGSLRDLRVRQGIGSGCDEEALRLLKASPKWTPGILAGEPVITYMIVPVTFQIN